MRIPVGNADSCSDGSFEGNIEGLSGSFEGFLLAAVTVASKAMSRDQTRDYPKVH